MEQNPYIVKELLDKSAPGRDNEPIPLGEQARKWFGVALRYSNVDLSALDSTAAAALPKTGLNDQHPVPADRRTKECDQACVASLLGLGELAEREKNPALAKQMYSLSLSVAERIGETEPLEQLRDSIGRV